MQTSTPVSPPLRDRPADLRRVGAAQAHADWVDAAKGIGIVLVVYGHAVDGLLAARLVDAQGGWAASYFGVYTFHMPLFFLLAGLFVPQRLAIDAPGFVRSAFVRIAWPYLLWSVVQLAVIGALGPFVNTPSSLGGGRIVSLLWEPTSQFWFLQALLVLHLLSAWLLPRLGATGLLVLMLLARLGAEWVDLPPLLGLPARFGLFYALGVAIAPQLLRRVPTLARPQAIAAAATAFVVWAVAAIGAHGAGQSHWSAAALPAALAGVAGVIALATLPRAGSFWIRLGQASMAIFLLHVLFVAGARIVLHKLLGVEQPAVILPLACAIGIGAPLLVRAAVQRAGLGRVLGLG
jgi:fucose 4-O-acetylase-like acetyltransferase